MLHGRARRPPFVAHLLERTDLGHGSGLVLPLTWRRSGDPSSRTPTVTRPCHEPSPPKYTVEARFGFRLPIERLLAINAAATRDALGQTLRGDPPKPAHGHRLDLPVEYEVVHQRHADAEHQGSLLNAEQQSGQPESREPLELLNRYGVLLGGVVATSRGGCKALASVQTWPSRDRLSASPRSSASRPPSPGRVASPQPRPSEADHRGRRRAGAAEARVYWSYASAQTMLLGQLTALGTAGGR